MCESVRGRRRDDKGCYEREGEMRSEARRGRNVTEYGNTMCTKQSGSYIKIQHRRLIPDVCGLRLSISTRLRLEKVHQLARQVRRHVVLMHLGIGFQILVGATSFVGIILPLQQALV